jgi:hypothetical protein
MMLGMSYERDTDQIRILKFLKNNVNHRGVLSISEIKEVPEDEMKHYGTLKHMYQSKRYRTVYRIYPKYYFFSLISLLSAGMSTQNITQHWIKNHHNFGLYMVTKKLLFRNKYLCLQLVPTKEATSLA